MAGSTSLLTGPRVELREVLPTDYDRAYALATEPAIGYRWRYQGLPPTPEAFVHSMYNGSLVQLGVCRKGTTDILGLAVALSPDFRHGHCQVAMLLAPEWFRTGLAIEAGTLLLRYIFATWPFHKVYCETPDFNYHDIASADGTLFTREVTLKHHRYFDGEYLDVHILSVDRETFESSTLARRVLFRRTSGVSISTEELYRA